MSEQYPNYRVRVTRDSGLWAAVVYDGLPADTLGATDVEHFDELGPAIRDLVGGLTETREDEFTIEWHYVQNNSDYTPVVLELQQWEARAAEATAQRDGFRAAAISAMRKAGLSLRDIADVMGISHQRVHQLQGSA